ncbi:MAG: DUF4317 domain-containing protein, partial [Lachnospiraceae bacterium]|nr:DUF4317 domain-containing protein [Lachnospiraceae bacterium]
QEEAPGGKQQFIMALRESKLKNDELARTFYQLVIDNYDYAGNYLIILFHDVYDVMAKTSDNRTLDESEEVYEYLLSAVCPVTLSKAALGYIETENRIGPRMRDWVVGVPDAGFVFPAFTGRSTDVHSTMFYTRDTKEPHDEFMEFILGCPARQTATEKKNMFTDIISGAVPDERKRGRVLYDIHETLQGMVDEKALFTEPSKEPEPIVLTPEAIRDVLSSSKVPEEIAERIGQSYVEKFTSEPPVADLLVDKKILSSGAHERREEELMIEVQQLKDELGQTKNELALVQNAEDADCGIILRVAPKKAEQITTQMIDGKRCIIIPVEEDESACINGEALFSQDTD